MEQSLSLKIMGVNERIDHIKFIADSLGIHDDDIVIDDRENGGCPYYTARKAWLDGDVFSKTHRLVLQDDVMLCDDFLSIVNTIIHTHPFDVVSLFPLYMPKTDKLKNLSSPYIKTKDVSGCAVIMPTMYVKDLFSWADKYDYYDDDTAITSYCNRNNIRVITTIPSTVQHIGNKSLIGHPYIETPYFQKKTDVDWYNKDVLDLNLYGRIHKGVFK